MDVAIEVQTGVGAHDGETAEHLVAEVERLHKIALVGLGLLFGQLQNVDDGRCVFHLLHHAGLVGAEAHMQFGVIGDYGQYGLTKGVVADVGRQLQTHGDVVQRGSGVLDTLEIDAGLCKRQRHFGGRFGLVGCADSRRTARVEQVRKQLVLNGLDGDAFGQLLSVELYVVALEDLCGQFDGGDGGQTYHTQVGSDAEIFVVDDLRHYVVQFLLKDIQRSGTFCGLGCSRLHLGLRQRAFVHFLVLIERNSIDLHGHRGHHIRRFAIHDERVQGLDIYLFVADDIGCDELAPALLFEGLDGGVFDSRVLANDALHFFELDAETAYLDLSVFAADKLDGSVLTIAHDITGAIDALAVPFYKRFSRFFGFVQVAQTDLFSGHEQFARRAPGQLFAVLAHDIQARSVVRETDRDVRLQLVHRITADIGDTLRRSVSVAQSIGRRVDAHQFLAARSQHLQRAHLGIVDSHLCRHLRGHERVGDTLFVEIVMHGLKVKANLVRQDV